MATRLFNVRIDEHLHKKFKEFCKENNVKMSDLILGYIQDVVDGKQDPKRKDKEKMKSYDPLAEIRNQFYDDNSV